MSLFQFSNEEMMTFFAVLVRYSVLFSLLPIVGDRMVPAPVKILLSISVSFVLFPGLVKMGLVRPADAVIWAATTGGIVTTLGSELLVGLVLGFTSKLVFDAIHIGANIAGSAMGFAMASTFDPHQETHTITVAEIQMAVAMLAFLALDGHHLILRAALESYQFCGLGQAAVGNLLQERIIDITATVFKFGIQLSAPVLIVMFGVNVAFGVFSKSMPQMNILILSLSITAFAGIMVMLLTAPEFQVVASNIMSHSGDWMNGMLQALAKK